MFGLIANDEVEEGIKALPFFGVCDMCMCEGVNGAHILWDARGERYHLLRGGPALDQLPGVRVFRALLNYGPCFQVWYILLCRAGLCRVSACPAIG